MDREMVIYSMYLVPLALVLVIYVWRHYRRDQRHLAQLRDITAAGLAEPATLHPVIDTKRCLGAGTCVKACVEAGVIGLIRGKAYLIDPSRCIGHGLCKAACPHDAITLVFGSATRGVDIPEVQPTFETNVPGLYIAGELGGMGLIRNATEQGRQAIESIKKNKGRGKQLDVVIVGAGPAGLSATLGAMQSKLRHVTIEQDSLGGTVAHYPRGKIVMTQPAVLPLVGKMKIRETTKEKLLGIWHGIVKKLHVKIRFKERLEDITKNGNGFTVKTTRGSYETRNVLLAIGRRGTPRKLGVPGEETSKVVYSLTDPEQYRNQHVLVVGGGDAALEAATSIADERGTTVTLSYRSAGFSRAKQKNRQKVDDAQAAGRLRVLLSSNVKEITQDKVLLDQEGTAITLPNNAIIVCAGGVLPTPFLKKIGISVETKYGTA